MANEPAGLPLADFIGALRAELRTAALAKDPQLQFNVGPVNVEFTLMTRHEGGGKAGIRFWVVEAGASASVAGESTQKVTLALTPVTASGDAWQVADEVWTSGRLKARRGRQPGSAAAGENPRGCAWGSIVIASWRCSPGR